MFKFNPFLTEWIESEHSSWTGDSTQDIATLNDLSIEQCSDACLKERIRSDPCTGYTFVTLEHKTVCYLKSWDGTREIAPYYTKHSGRIKLPKTGNICLSIPSIETYELFHFI